MIRPAMTRLILLLAALGLPGVAASDLQIERVIALGKLWADVRYFHSYLAYRDIEWDAALVKAIPKVKAAGSKEEYAAAIQSMLDTLEDPVTRVLKDAPRSAPEGNREPAQMDGDILVLRFTGAGVSPALRQETRKAGSALAAARGLVIDMRWVRNPDAILRDSGLVNNARGELILQRLSKTSLYRLPTARECIAAWLDPI